MSTDDNAEMGKIELRIRELAQLFNSLDPSPFRERDLDDDAEEYILSWARELPDEVAITLVVHLTEAEAKKAREHGLDAALSNYFAERAKMHARNLKELFRRGRSYLSIGIPVLFGCITASQVVRANLEPGPIARVAEESLIIVGWVANWKPLETFLYDWWPMKRERDLYLRLARARLLNKEH